MGVQTCEAVRSSDMIQNESFCKSCPVKDLLGIDGPDAPTKPSRLEVGTCELGSERASLCSPLLPPLEASILPRLRQYIHQSGTHYYYRNARGRTSAISSDSVLLILASLLLLRLLRLCIVVPSPVARPASASARWRRSIRRVYRMVRCACYTYYPLKPSSPRSHASFASTRSTIIPHMKHSPTAGATQTTDVRSSVTVQRTW